MTAIIKYYYWIVALLGFTLMIGFRDWYSLVVLVIVFVAAKSIITISWKTIDTLVLVYLAYSLISYGFSDYRFEMYYYGIKAQFIPTLFYYIARGKYFQTSEFIDNIKWPLLLVFILSIILYFFPPGWYTDFKTKDLMDSYTTTMIYERTRMSGFWPHSYFIGYSSLIFIIYSITQLIFGRENRIYAIWYILIAIICLFFSQQRVCIAYFLLFLSFSVYYTFSKNLNAKKELLYLLLTISLGGVLIFIIVTTYMDTDYLEYIINRSSKYEGNLIEDRILTYKKFFDNISILGDGLGKYGHASLYEFNKESITDCDYLRLLNEIGIVGTVLLMTILWYTTRKGLKKIRMFYFETFTIIFFLIAMIGATPLEMSFQQPYMLWFCIGHINNNRIVDIPCRK